jgi:cell division transport system permease protein
MASVMDDLRGFRRSWVHHTGMQLATLSVLSATFAVVAFVLITALNLNRLLVSWGESVEMSIYLTDSTDQAKADRLLARFKAMPELINVRYIGREQATDNFKHQMASYAPGLLNDPDFTNPFPASFRVALKGGIKTDHDVKRMEELASQIGLIDGVEDVSFGQGWVKNYSSFVSVLSGSGAVIILILSFGSLFVIGNSVRMSISSRREEVEILELVGATPTMIRRPFVIEGLLMGFTAAAVAVGINFAVYLWQLKLMSSSLVFMRLASQIAFPGVFLTLSFFLVGGLLGSLGAWLAVRQINDGWSASQRAD